ncbi:zinc finger BED domain-containing protein RICESLEEPER 1-like [Arachis hypogaea]|uniref:zinc finger BED domain-containing protein RICESLEEPER 1-like n=1 Tax=Arachis hypogaea TaxID=3818 RepID=UPI000DEC8A88|nr:zinc finger BED domain-containing protein RICESLEEPER 1-like [Arachis hypogaea]
MEIEAQNPVTSAENPAASAENPTASTIDAATTPAKPQVNEEDKDTNIENPEASRRGKKSYVWQHFTVLLLTETKGQHQAKCNHCQKKYGCHPTKHGTNSLNKHLKNAHKWIFTKEGKKGTLHGYMPKIEEEQDLCKAFKGYNLEDCKKSVAEFVVLDEMPFKVVEGIGFRKMLNHFEPRFTVPSRWTVSRDCFQLYLDEKKKLKEWLAKSCARVCLTTDCWTSTQNYNYMSLMAHFVDDEWKLQKRIINFCHIENHKGDTVGREIEKCLREWGIEKVFTITVDNSSSNDGAITYLQRKLGARGGLVCGGKYMQVRCCAHVLNLIVNEGIKEQQTSIESIRNAVRYVRSSPQRTKKFKDYIEAELIESKSLVCLDVPTRWNSTYLMLEHAEKFEKAFDRLYDQEPDYLRWFGEDSGEKKKIGPPTPLDWQHARLFIDFLRIFYEITLSFSSSLHVTSNKCFHEIASVASQLTSWSQNQSELLGSMACSMKHKYDKYWGPVDKFNPLLLVAVVLDPRYKLDYLCWCLEDVYDNEVSTNMTDFVKLTLDTLHKFYEKEVADDKRRDDGGDSSRDIFDDTIKVSAGAKGVSENRVNMWKKQKREKANADSKSDVERYLAEDTVEDENFDILAWWKVNASKYRVLSLIARDILGIPVSTVASESCFSTGGRVVDVFRSSLSPLMAEALICTQSWLCPSKQRDGDQEFDLFDNSQKIVEALKEVMSNAHHRKCVMHIRKNIINRFKDLHIREIVWECVKCTTIPEFKETMEKLKEVNKAAWEYVMKFDPVT